MKIITIFYVIMAFILIQNAGCHLDGKHYGAAVIVGLTSIILTILYVGFFIIREIRKGRYGD